MANVWSSIRGQKRDITKRSFSRVCGTRVFNVSRSMAYSDKNDRFWHAGFGKRFLSRSGRDQLRARQSSTELGSKGLLGLPSANHARRKKTAELSRFWIVNWHWDVRQKPKLKRVFCDPPDQSGIVKIETVGQPIIEAK